MASQEDDNIIECNSNTDINIEHDKNFLNVYKQCECILKNKPGDYGAKVKSLIDVWKSFYDITKKPYNIQQVLEILDWAKLHTLELVLTADWRTYEDVYKEQLLSYIHHSEKNLFRKNQVLGQRLKQLLDVAKDPWDDPVLNRLMKEDVTIGPQEIAFFCKESAYLISVRLSKLCEYECKDFALRLVTSFMECHKKEKTENFSLNATENQIWFLFDLRLALLHQARDNNKVVKMIQELSFDNGLRLVQRFTKKRVKIAKIWKHNKTIAHVACQVYLTRALTQCNTNQSEELKDFIKSFLEQLIIHSTADELETDFGENMAKLTFLVVKAPLLYCLCEYLQSFQVKLKEVPVEKLNPCIIQMYIRALTTDMNELEKYKTENHEEMIAEASGRLAKGYCKLGSFLTAYINVERECVLTAFSLEPTKERLTHIEELARKSGYTVYNIEHNWKCRLHPPVLPCDELLWRCSQCGEWACCKQEITEPTVRLNISLDEALQNSILGISEDLIVDLVVCLSHPRYQLMSWKLPWQELHRLCIMYLHDPEATKNFVTELKYLEIDYSLFQRNIKREPGVLEQEMEDRYEQFLDQNKYHESDSESDSEASTPRVSHPLSVGSSGPENNYFKNYAKSDPNTLKSLRSFRLNCKKTREKEPSVKTSEDVLAIFPEVRSVENSNHSENGETTLSKLEKTSEDVLAIFPEVKSVENSNQSENGETTLSKLEKTSEDVLAIFPEVKSVENSNQSKNGKTTLSKLGGQTEVREFQVNQSTKESVPNSPSLNKVIDTSVNPNQSTHSQIVSKSENSENLQSTPLHQVPFMEKILFVQIQPLNISQMQKQTTKHTVNNSIQTPKLVPNSNQPSLKVVIDSTMSPKHSTNSQIVSKQGNLQSRPLHQMPSMEKILFVKIERLNISQMQRSPLNRRNEKCGTQIVLKKKEAKTTEAIVILEKQLEVAEKESSQSKRMKNEKSTTHSLVSPKRETITIGKRRVSVYNPIQKINSSTTVRKELLPCTNQKPLTPLQNVDHQEGNLANIQQERSAIPTHISNTNPSQVHHSQAMDTLLQKPTSKVLSSGINDSYHHVFENRLQNRYMDQSCFLDQTNRKNPMNVLLPKNSWNSQRAQDSSALHISDKIASAKTNLITQETCKENLEKPQKSPEPTKEELIRRMSVEVVPTFRTYSNKYKRVKTYSIDLTKEPFLPITTIPVMDLTTEEETTVTSKSWQKPDSKATITSGSQIPNYSILDILNQNIHNNNSDTNIHSRPWRFDLDPTPIIDEQTVAANSPKRTNSSETTAPPSIPRSMSSSPIQRKRKTKKNSPNNKIQSNQIKSDVTEKRQGLANKSYVQSVLSKIPGLNDYQMIQPSDVDQIINVVQISGGRSAQSVSIPNSQTSTQVTPHIQRIGQPRISDQKYESTVTTNTSSSTTRSSPLINILSQQIIRPANTPSNTGRRQPPVINILSQQIIRPPDTVATRATANTTNSCSTTEAIEAKIDAGSEPTILNSAIKTTNSLVKNPNTVTSGQGGTILQFICKSSLPKFQQAFGKTVYQSNTESAESPTTVVESSNTNNTAETKKATVTTKTVPVNVQPIQGSVIYSRQVPVGQTISLIPPGTTTRQVFRIATSSHEQLSLVKDSVIHTKMSALLAAALQGRPKNADGEIQVNCEEVKSVTGRPTLVQGARIVKPVQLQLPANVVKANPQPNLSSTTLEQLREFDMVYKQIKERSNPSTSEANTNSGESQEITPQRISVTYVNQLQKYTQLSPVVVVTTYNNLQPVASPALSVTSQGSSSPCVTPASTPTMPKIVTKSSKGKTLKTSPNNNTAAAKSSPIPKPQQKPQEDEHTTQRIFDILAEYAEQLRNSPDLNNKPAPRRRSNPPTNPSQNSKRKKSSGVKKSGQSTTTIDLDADDLTIGSEDSSGGVVQLSVTDDEQSQASASVATESTDNASPPSSRPLIIAESGPCNNQSRNLIIADSSVGEALKMPNTAVIVPGSYIMPVSMVKGGQQIAVVSGSSKILATVPARSGQNMLLFQSFTNQTRKTAIPAVKYSTIQPISGITSQTLAGVSQQPMILPSNSVATAVSFGQPLTLKKIGDDREGNELLLTISQRKEDIKERSEIPQPDSSTSVSSDSVDIKLEDSASQSDSSNEKIFHTYQKTVINSVETSVIATTSSTVKNEGSVSNPSGNATPATSIKAEARTVERMQSVLVTACSSNGPMLSHTTPRYRKVSEAARPHTSELPVTKGDFLHNGQKPSGDQKNIRTNTTYYVNKTKKILVESQKIDSEMQKKAAMERELRLQKSLSEECEDLGVDEPSASDLFPEADLLFDSNHSPSYDQAHHDVVKRVGDVKEEVKESLNLFSDDETSSSLRTDLFEYVEYDEPVGTSLEYEERELNGNIAETGSSGCEDNTLLPKCAAMSEVTLNSPISPEIYQEVNTHNKYKFKYSNRKKGERMKQSEFTGEVVTSSEDTIVCTQLNKVHCVEESYKILHIGKTELLKEGEKCELHCDEDVDSPSGRGARRSVRKLCSCCNGSQDGTLAKKRPHTSRPHTPAAPHKKSFLAKKR